MTYQEIFSAAKACFEQANTRNIHQDFAFQFNIIGEGEGIFYVEFRAGKLSIEPYDYHDRDVIFTCDAPTLLALGTGKIEPVEAMANGELCVDGDYELSKYLMFLVNNPKTLRITGEAKKK